MTILCGTDLSANATRAVSAAAALAWLRHESVHLLHVVDLPGAAEHLSREMTDKGRGAELWREELGRRRELLRAEAQRIARPGVDVVAELIAGVPDDVLVAQAEQLGVSLLVLASLGRRAGGSWGLGSTADRTAQRSKVPVLVVRDAAPFERWAKERRPLRVLAAVSFSTTADAALRWASSLNEVAPCEILPAHVYSRPEELARVGAEKGETLEASLARELGARIAGLGVGPMATPVVRSGLGKPAEHLSQLARELEVDLVVVGTHQRKGLELLWHGSVSYGVVQASAANVVCVPTATVAKQEQKPLPRPRCILAATDLSELGNRSVGFAYALLPEGGTVHLLHILSTPLPLDPIYAMATAGGSPEERARLVSELEQRLRALVPSDPGVAGVETRVEVVEELGAADAIARAARRHGADLVCVASHGRSGLAKALLGSVAQEVLRLSPVPVLVVPPVRDA